MKYKITSAIVATATFLNFSCNPSIESPADLIAANLEATSGSTDWTQFSSRKVTVDVITEIGGNTVNNERRVVSTKLPGWQRTAIYRNEELSNTVLTTDTESLFVVYDKGKYKGLSTIPKEDIVLNRIEALKSKAAALTLKDSIFDQTAVWVIRDAESKTEYVFDKEKSALLALISPGGYGLSTTRFSDYREVDGYLLPFKEEIDIPESGYRMELTYSEILVNPQFEENLFTRDEAWVSLEAGQAFPSFELPLLNGEGTVGLETVKGKLTLIDFWASWCKPCIAEFPNIKENYKRYREKGFEVLSISIDETPERALNYTNKKPFDWPYSAFLEGGFQSELASECQVIAIPKPVLIDGNGNIVAMDAAVREEKLAEQIEAYFTE